MRPTPRTDSQYIYELVGVEKPLVRADFARTLERETVALRSRLDSLASACAKMRQCVKPDRIRPEHVNACARCQMNAELEAYRLAYPQPAKGE